MHNPFEVTLENQAEDERILFVWRHHPVTLFKPALRSLAFLVLPVLLTVITGFSWLSNVVLFGLFVVIILICLTYAASEWVSWYNDIYILTNYRVIDVQQEGFFHRTFKEASLSRIQDITYEVKGVMASVFNYGLVEVQTAGTENAIKMTEVANPPKQSKIIGQEQQRFVDDNPNSLSADELVSLLAKHRNDLDKLAEFEAEAQRQKAKSKTKEKKKPSDKASQS